jgi:hypothetical protein
MAIFSEGAFVHVLGTAALLVASSMNYGFTLF